MRTEEQSVRERIFLAALACIEQQGIDNVTVRGIAKEANVNSAAINYYFGTKDRLIEQVLSRTLREGLGGSLDEFEDFVNARGGDVRAALKEFLPMFFGQMVSWPRLAEAQLHEALTQQVYDSPAIKEIDSFLTRFLEIVRPIVPERTEDEHWRAVLHLWLPMMFLGMLPHAFEASGKTSVADENWRDAYVHRLLEVFLEEPMSTAQNGSS